MKLEECRVEIVGLGQIGSSLALSLLKNKAVKQVIGFSRSRKTAALAVKRKIVTKSFTDESEIFRQDADVVIFAVPVQAAVSLIKKIPRGQRSILFMDVVSVKREVVQAARKKGIPYVSIHPMAGTEKTGIKSCHSDLFKNRPLIVFPVNPPLHAYKKIMNDLAKGIGSFPIYVKGAEEHDEVVGVVSHLSHLFAYTLLHTAARESRSSRIPLQSFWKCAGPSFQDASRVAGSSPEMVFDFLWSNRRTLVPILDSAVRELSTVRHWFKSSKKMEMMKWIEEGGKLKELTSSAFNDRK
jgi:prephenate dehydrogenase